MVIKKLAETYPDLAEHLMNIHDNIKDLMVPFQKKNSYSAALQGSYSIKYVLPALCPDDPELDYHNLDGIHNGGEAMTAFADLEHHTPEKIERIRKTSLPIADSIPLQWSRFLRSCMICVRIRK